MKNQQKNNPGSAEKNPQSNRLSDYPDGNDDVKLQADRIPGNQTDQPYTEGKTIAEATDPSKLSDI